MDTLEQAGVEMDPEELEHMQTMGTSIYINQNLDLRNR
jgi:hypothetical protein